MEWFSWVGDPNAWVSLITLTFLEIVLGIDNVIFISILAGKLPAVQQAKARTIGLALALITRILLLLSIKWLIGLTEPLGTIFSHTFSSRDLILLAGGLFLIAKSTHEIHVKLETASLEPIPKTRGGFLGTVIQIALLDIVFTRFGHHGRGHGERSCHNDCRRDHRGPGNVAGGRHDQQFRRSTPDH
jgi:predicted tellurium resistance membrane protein TerC